MVEWGLGVTADRLSAPSDVVYIESALRISTMIDSQRGAPANHHARHREGNAGENIGNMDSEVPYTYLEKQLDQDLRDVDFPARCHVLNERRHELLAEGVRDLDIFNVEREREKMREYEVNLTEYF